MQEIGGVFASSCIGRRKDKGFDWDGTGQDRADA
jgi:hypothetical protein